jgi:hypothetical protein
MDNMKALAEILADDSASDNLKHYIAGIIEAYDHDSKYGMPPHVLENYYAGVFEATIRMVECGLK